MDEASTARNNVCLAVGVVIGKGNVTCGGGYSVLRGEFCDGVCNAVMGLYASVCCVDCACEEGVAEGVDVVVLYCPRFEVEGKRDGRAKKEGGRCQKIGRAHV